MFNSCPYFLNSGLDKLRDLIKLSWYYEFHLLYYLCSKFGTIYSLTGFSSLNFLN